MKTGSPGCTAHGLGRMSSEVLDGEFSFLPSVLGSKSIRGRRSTVPLPSCSTVVLSGKVSLNHSV